jgi:hypothetical protein
LHVVRATHQNRVVVALPFCQESSKIRP